MKIYFDLYWVGAGFVSLFFAIRSCMAWHYVLADRKEESVSLPSLRSRVYHIVRYYIPDFWLHFICTLFGFFCARKAWEIYSLNDFSNNKLTFFGFMVALGLIGVTGRLGDWIAQEKFPGVK